MSSAISFFIKRPLIANLIIVFLLLAGSLSLLFIKREAFPNVNLYQVQIKTIYPGASPADVEQKVTIPIEEKLREVTGFGAVRSTSRNSESEIGIKVDIDNKTPDKVIDDIRRAVDKVTDLPKEIREKPIVIEQKSSDFPIMDIAFYGAKDEIELQTKVKFFQDELRKVSGVARVDAFGKRKKEWQVLVNPEIKKRLSIGLQDVVQSISERNVSIPGGSIFSKFTKDIRISGEFTEISDLNKLPIRANDIGNTVYLSQISRLKDTYEKERVIASMNSEDAIVLTVVKKESADIIRTVKIVDEKLEIFKNNLPPNMKILKLNDEGIKTVNRLNVVISNSMQGLGLILVVLFIFFSLRDSILTSLSLPLSLLGALMFLPILDVSFNLVSMLGIIISLGMLVDNSIVISENIYSFRMKGYSAVDAAIKGTTELVVPIIGSYLTTVAAFIPMLSMSGIMGKFIYQIPLMVIITLSFSLLESFFLLPVRIAMFGKVKTEEEKNNSKIARLRNKLDIFFENRIRGFENFIRKVVKYKYISLASIVFIFAGTMIIQAFVLRFNLFPKEGIEQVLIKAEFPSNFTSRETLTRMRYLNPILEKISKKDMIGYVTKIGVQQTDPTDPLARYGENLGMVHLYFIPEDKRKRTTEQIIKEFEFEIKNIPDAKNVFIEELINGPPVGAAVTLAVEGGDYKKLKEISLEIQKSLSSIKGVKNITDDYNIGREEIIVNLSPEKATTAGVTVANTAQFVRGAFEGIEASRFRIGKDEIYIRVLNDDKFRSNQNDINKIDIQNRYGLLTPISSIANIKTEQGIEAYLHFDFEKAVTITANVDEKITSSGIVNDQILKEYKDLEKKLPGYRLKFRGEQEDSEKSMASLGVAGIVAIFGIFAILALIFNNLIKPLIIIASIPLGLIGVVLVL